MNFVDLSRTCILNLKLEFPGLVVLTPLTESVWAPETLLTRTDRAASRKPPGLKDVKGAGVFRQAPGPGCISPSQFETALGVRRWSWPPPATC